jgi:hypothetical protein
MSLFLPFNMTHTCQTTHPRSSDTVGKALRIVRSGLSGNTFHGYAEVCVNGEVQTGLTLRIRED